MRSLAATVLRSTTTPWCCRARALRHDREAENALPPTNPFLRPRRGAPRPSRLTRLTCEEAVATIDANPPSGTRDYLPARSPREEAFATIREVFRRHGFDPLDTPAFERLEVLTGKYGEEGDQLIFKILRRGEHEATGRPTWRCATTSPCRWRGSRRATAPSCRPVQALPDRAGVAGRPARQGRFREFYQCDLDTVGSASLVADADDDRRRRRRARPRSGCPGFRCRSTTGRRWRALIEAYGVPAALEGDTLVALDKLDKIGVDGVPPSCVSGASRRGRRRAGRRPRGGRPPGARRRALASHRARGAHGARGDRPGASSWWARRPAVTVEHAPVLGAWPVLLHRPRLRGRARRSRRDHRRWRPLRRADRHVPGQDVPATGGSLGLERILLLLEHDRAGRRRDAPTCGRHGRRRRSRPTRCARLARGGRIAGSASTCTPARGGSASS
jgi:histidyl-tRNA synthetase